MVMKTRVLSRSLSLYFTSLRASGKSFMLFAPVSLTVWSQRSPVGAVHLAGAGTAVLRVLFGSQNEEAQGLMKTVQASEVKVGTVHDIEGSGFGDKLIKDIDVVEFAVGNVNECGDIATQVQKCVKFYG